MQPTATQLEAVRAAAERLLAAREDGMVTAEEWDALERAINACNDGGSASA